MSAIITTAKPVPKGLFPLDDHLGLDETAYSRQMAQKMVWLSGLLPYQQCQMVMREIGERFIPPSSIWRQTQRHGAQLQAAVEHQREQMSVERIQLPDARHDHDQRMAVSMDGGMVNIRGQGWRELKVGAVFEVETRLERNPQTRELDPMAHAVNLHYTAVLGTKDEFMPALWALAVEHDLPTARNRSVVADGALWIWEVAEDICPDGQQVVDWFHAVTHLSEAAHALYPNPDDGTKRQRWLNIYKHHLYMGRIHLIIKALGQHGLARFATYFERHQRRMQYLEFREAGLPIGSGTVESGVKQFKHRLCGAGMRWHLHTAQRMLVIRSAVLGNTFHSLWAVA